MLRHVRRKLHHGILFDRRLDVSHARTFERCAVTGRRSSCSARGSRSRRLDGFLFCLRFFFFFLVGNYIQTSADGVIISQ